MKKISWIIAAAALLFFASSAVWLIFDLGRDSDRRIGRTDLPPVADRGQPEPPASLEGYSNNPLGRWGFEFPREQIPAISFEVETLSGEFRRLEDYSGNLLILNFWATWCPPCREEIPSMEQMMKELEGTGISMLAVSTMEERSVVEDFVNQRAMSLPVALDESGELGVLYGVQNIPTTYLIDGQGNLLARKRGAMEWDEPELISQLLFLN